MEHYRLSARFETPAGEYLGGFTVRASFEPGTDFCEVHDYLTELAHNRCADCNPNIEDFELVYDSGPIEE